MTTDRSEFIKLVAPDVITCPSAIVERETVGAIIEFCEKSDIFTKEFNVELDSDDIDSDTQNSIDIVVGGYLGDTYRPVSMIACMVDSTPYTPESREIMNTVTYWDSIKDPNVKYFHFVDNYRLRLYDMSTSDDYVYIKLTVKPLRTATVFDDVLYEDYAEVIAAGAKYRILSNANKLWANPSMLNENYRKWRRGLSRAKLRRNKNFTHVSQHVNWQSFED